MSWTSNITCSQCGSTEWWSVENGVWTCGCGKAMTQAEIKPYHKQLAQLDSNQQPAD